ncbi:MAG: PD-(D/E)XK nuclease family protein [Candidatus Poseidoniaceae archaeon]
MPAQIPPEAQSIGRSRSRLSASSLTTFLRCKKQWFLNYRIGLRGPVSPPQIMGIEVEDAFCSILMHRAPIVDSVEDLSSWLEGLIDEYGQKAIDNGINSFEESIWKDGEFSDYFDIEIVCNMLRNGIGLQLEEVKKCFEAGGGQTEFEIPAPCWDNPPTFLQPEKANSMVSWKDEIHVFSNPITWQDAWEIARPWVKDPRNPEPQRMYHADRWAAGECDLVHRWDGRTRIIDVKIGDGEGSFSSSLKHQLNFYAWLWNETHDSTCDGIEGWYLKNGLRKEVDLNPKTTEEYREIYEEMRNWNLTNAFPIDEPCSGEQAGCRWCKLDQLPFEKPMISSPCELISTIPYRVNVKGSLQASWGPLPNHYGELVLGAMIKSGDKMVTLEESQPNSFPKMHDSPQDEVIVTGALPGVWRGQPRLYLDNQSSIEVGAKCELTRMGMLRTKANVQGIVISISRRNGIRADGRPWSMVSLHIWDGESVAELVAFGSSIKGSILSMKQGDEVRIISADLGWREGIIQLRVDKRTTRIEILSKD